MKYQKFFFKKLPNNPLVVVLSEILRPFLFLLFTSFFQLPDDAGTPRVIANPDGNKILVGTSRNTLFSGDFETNFEEIVDVSCLSKTQSIYKVKLRN